MLSFKMRKAGFEVGLKFGPVASVQAKPRELEHELRDEVVDLDVVLKRCRHSVPGRNYSTMFMTRSSATHIYGGLL